MTETPVFTFDTAAESPAAHTPLSSLARPVVPAAEERARLKEGVHIERSSRRVRTYFGGKLIADSERRMRRRSFETMLSSIAPGRACL